MATRFETLGVLAGAYRDSQAVSSMLRHVCRVETDDNDNIVSLTPLCKRVKADNICVDGYTDAEMAEAATCPVCVSRDPRREKGAELPCNCAAPNQIQCDYHGGRE